MTDIDTADDLVDWNCEGAEQALLDGKPDNGAYVFSGEGDKKNNIIRGSFIAALARGRLCIDNTRISAPHQIVVGDAYISGKIDLSDCTCAMSLWIINSDFEKSPDFERASLQSLNFSNSSLPGANFEDLTLKGNLTLNNIISTEALNFYRSILGGQLNINDAELSASNGQAIKAQSIQVKDGVFLDRSTIKGSIIIDSAHIGGQFNANNATIMAKSGGAIRAQGARIDGGFFLDGSEITGMVQINTIEIGGQFSANHATLTSKSEKVLNAQDARIKGSVFLNNSKVTGTVDFNSATIGGQLNANNATLASEFGRAVNAQGAAINGSVLLNGSKIKGEVSFNSSKVAGQFGAKKSEFQNDSGASFNLHSSVISGGIFWMSSEFKGLVSLNKANIGVQLDATDVKFFAKTGPAILAQYITIDGAVFLEGAVATGEMNFHAAKIRGTMFANKAGPTIRSIGGDALVLTSARIEGNLNLHHMPHPYFGNINLENTHCKKINWSDKSFPSDALRLDGFTYDVVGYPETLNRPKP